MEHESAIERNIKDFVYSKIHEQVFVDIVRWEKISIRHRSRHGSIALAMFWLRVMRHRNNYPMPKYPYKDVYDKNGHNQVILKVDRVTITVFMNSGTLLIEGHWALEWFVNTFQKIMDAYDAPIREPQPPSTVNRQYTESWKSLEEEQRVKKAEAEAIEKEKVDKALQIVSDSENIPTTVQDVVHEAAQDDTDDPSSVVERLQQAKRKVEKRLAEEKELMSLDHWSGSVLRTQLESLRTCSVRNGSTYIYTLWKSLLQRWFNDPNRKVYIATPRLDADRLVDICNVVIEHRLTANLDALYVLHRCDQNRTIFEIKKSVQEKFEPMDQLYIEYKIFSHIVCPTTNFHARFIASVKGNEAEVLTTSADFNGEHFIDNNMDTVHYQNMSDIEFISRFLGPLGASLHGQ